MRTLTIVDANDACVEPTWRSLASPSYFLSWGWVETWLASLPVAHHPRLAILLDEVGPLAACFVRTLATIRHHVVPTRVMFVNATGVPRLDELCIEHNGLVRRPGEPATLAELVAALSTDWDEIALPGIDPGELATIPPAQLHIDRAVAAPYVDLARVRETPGGYLELVGASARAQIRRARRGAGVVEIEHARTLDRAFAIYGELVGMHSRSWAARGETGAFADRWFDDFHRRLIANRFASGEIDLVRVTADGQAIGCLYNFVYRGAVLFYQSGLARLSDPRIKPGFLCHAAAIEDAARAGHAIYDFLGGNARYKHSLATNETRLVWARMQHPHARFTVEEWLRARRRAA